MKRNFILLLLPFFVVMNGYGQIDREYMGFKIGSSTKDEVLKQLESDEEGTEIMSYTDNNISTAVITKLLSGDWRMVNYEFQDNLLQSVIFLISDERNGLSSALLVAQKGNVEKELMDKYAQYFSKKASRDDLKLYVDAKTMIFFQSLEIASFNFLKLTIIDKDFYLKQRKRGR